MKGGAVAPKDVLKKMQKNKNKWMKNLLKQL